MMHLISHMSNKFSFIFIQPSWSATNMPVLTLSLIQFITIYMIPEKLMGQSKEIYQKWNETKTFDICLSVIF